MPFLRKDSGGDGDSGGADGEPEAAGRPPAGAIALRAAELALPVVFLTAAFLVAPATPFAVRASPVVHLAGLAVMVLILLRLEKLPTAWDGWLAVAIGVAAEQCLVLTPGVPLGHDTGVHLWGAAAIADALRDGGSPLWLHRLGAGVPLLQFYPPLGFVPIVAAHLGGLPLHAAFRLAFVLFAAVGSFGVQRAVREWTGDRRAALVAAAAFAFAPYRLFDAHFRSALGETAALAILPFVCMAFQRVLARRGGVRLLAVTGATLALVHLLSVVLAAYGLLVWWIAHAASLGRAAWRRSLATLPPLLAAAGGGLALIAFFVCPLLADLGATSLRRTVPIAGVWMTPGVQPIDWLGAPRDAPAPARPRRQRPVESASPSPVAASSVPKTGAPLPFGATLLAGLLLLLVQTVAERMRRAGQPSSADAEEARALRLGVLAAGLFGLAFSLEASTGWNVHLPLVRVLQFSWRGLGLATVAASLGVGLALARAKRGRGGTAVALLFLAAIWGEGWLHAGARGWLQPWDALGAMATAERPGLSTTTPLPRRHRRISGHVVPPSLPGTRLSSGLLEPFFEYTNPRAHELGKTAKPRLAVSLAVRRNGTRVQLPALPYAEWRLGKRWRPLRARVLGGRIAVRARRPGTVLVREQCFPGWQERTAAGWQPAACSPDGFLQAEVSHAGPVEWRFFAWRWPRVAGVAISVLALVGLFVTSGRWWRR